MKKSSLLLTLTAFVLILTAGIGYTLGYFTANDHALGGKVIVFGGETEIKENVEKFVKHVTIKADDNSESVYVRVMAYAGSGLTLTYTSENAGDWVKGTGDDPFWYYTKPISKGELTTELLIKIDGVPETPDLDDNFEEYNVAVVEEFTPVMYDSNGNPYYDFSAKLIVEEG